MLIDVYRYAFLPHVAFEDVEATLLLALWGAESLHGEAQVRLDAAVILDRDRRACGIGTGTQVGRDINRLFVGFLGREYSADSFRIDRLVTIDGDIEEVMA